MSHHGRSKQNKKTQHDVWFESAVTDVIHINLKKSSLKSS